MAAARTSPRTLSSDDIAAAKSLYDERRRERPTQRRRDDSFAGERRNAAAGTAVTFSGSAIDTPDGDISSNLIWRSNIDRGDWTGASFSRALTAGIAHHHRDGDGQQRPDDEDERGGQRHVDDNTAPSVTIIEPGERCDGPGGTSMTFSGSASDPEDGNLTAKLVWRSNLDGQIGTGGSFTRALTAGTHTITASVTDDGGMTRQKTVSVSATSSSCLAFALALVARADDTGVQGQGVAEGRPILERPDASSVDVYRSGSKITTTGNDGSMTDSINERGGGSYSYKVCAAGTSTCTNQASVSF